MRTRCSAVSAILAGLLILAAFLMGTGALVIERTASAVGGLFDAARPPHFLQMHVGDFDATALHNFADTHPDVSDFHLVTMANVDGAHI